MSVEERFAKVVYLIRNGPKVTGASNNDRLAFYKYYKQANEGDVTGSQPWAVQLEARAKWDAWNSVKGMSKEDAMQKYIDLVAADNADWESHEVLKGYTPQ